MRRFIRTPSDTSLLLLITGFTMVIVQFGVLPRVQRRLTPRRTLQVNAPRTILSPHRQQKLFQTALVFLTCCYLALLYSRTFTQMIIISAVQTAAYALAFAETCTQITTSVESAQLGAATGN